MVYHFSVSLSLSLSLFLSLSQEGFLDEGTPQKGAHLFYAGQNVEDEEEEYKPVFCLFIFSPLPHPSSSQ